MVYLMSFLTGLAALLAAVFLSGIVLVAKLWMFSGEFMFGGVDGGIIAGPVLVASFLIFAGGFSWQYLRMSRKA
jgi:hypothetical protein